MTNSFAQESETVDTLVFEDVRVINTDGGAAMRQELST